MSASQSSYFTTTICNLLLTMTNQIIFCFIFICMMLCFVITCFLAYFNSILTLYLNELKDIHHYDKFLSYTCLTNSNYSCTSQYPSINSNYLAEQMRTIVITRHDVYVPKHQRK